VERAYVARCHLARGALPMPPPLVRAWGSAARFESTEVVYEAGGPGCSVSSRAQRPRKEDPLPAGAPPHRQELGHSPAIAELAAEVEVSEIADLSKFRLCSATCVPLCRLAPRGDTLCSEDTKPMY